MPLYNRPFIENSMTTNSDRIDIRKRAIIIGLLLVIINAYWVGIASELWYSVFTFVNPFSNAVFSLAVLLVLNFALGKISKRLSFTPAELLVMYTMIIMVSTIAGHTMMSILMGTLAQPYWFASPENEWQQLFWKYIPSWLTITDTNALKGYFTGESSFHRMDHIKAWFGTILVWSGFIFVLYFSLLCISSILRRQWTENEKLSYPLIQLPLEMATNRKFFASKLLWIGFAIAASVRILNIFHDIFPSVPQAPYGFRLDQYFTDKPWNAIGYAWMSYNFAVVGLTYFMPLDLSFSCWFFFWLTRAERVFASIVGWQNLYLNERASGAWIGICMIALWSSRRHLTSFFLHVFGRRKLDDDREPMRYRTNFILLLLSFGAVVLFCYFAGMSLWAIFAFYALFYILAIAIGRVRAELGPPYHEVIGINPRQMMVDIFGSRRLMGNNLTIISFLYAFNRCNRAHPMPNQLESLRIGDKVGMNSRKLLQALSLAIIIGAIATFWSYLQISYKYGVLTQMRGTLSYFGWESLNPLQTWLQYPQGSNPKAMGFMGGGFAFVILLYIMRTRFLWWPLHASGYVLSGAAWGGMIYFWFPVMVSWLIKLLILKHGGGGTYKKGIPLFLGLVLGDYIPRSIASIVSLILNIYMPSSGAGHML